VYGPRQRQDLEGGVIAIFLGCWRRGDALTVFGDGGAERDYMYVGDVTEAVSAVLGSNVTGVYNIGTGVATSVNALIELMSEVLGEPKGVQHAPERAGEIQRSCVDIAKAAREGLWRPRTSLRDGLEKTAQLA
jgi:UDP-glucose 4-epimerase